MTVGEKIKQLRIDCGYSQRDLAEEVGVEQTAISRYENDVCVPNVIIFARLCKALDAVIAELMEDIDWN